MAFTKKTTEQQDVPVEIKQDYIINVDRATIVNEKRVLFTATVNGIKIDGLALIEYVNQAGETGYMVQMPSRKGKDNKWYNTVFFPISKENKQKIIDQVFSLIG